MIDGGAAVDTGHKIELSERIAVADAADDRCIRNNSAACRKRRDWISGGGGNIDATFETECGIAIAPTREDCARGRKCRKYDRGTGREIE